SVIGKRQIFMGTLQVIEEHSAIERNSGLFRQALKERQPIPVGIQRGAMEDLQYALDLIPGNQRGGKVSNEIFAVEQGDVVEFRFGTFQVRDMHNVSLDSDAAGRHIFIQTQHGLL